MPRDGSGVYTLPAGNPVVTNTLIQSSWANPTMSDIAVQLNNVVTRDGLLGPTGQFKLADGTVAAPGIAFNSEPGLGVFRPLASIMGYAAGNAQIAALDASTTSATYFSLYNRSGVGTPAFVLANAPKGSANFTQWAFQITGTNVALNQATSGTGTILPFTANASQFTLNGNATAYATLIVSDASNASGAGIKFEGNGGTTPYKYIKAQAGQLYFINSAASVVIAQLSDAGFFQAANIGITSDMRLKDNIERSLGAKERLSMLHGYTYEKDGQKERGVLAQEVMMYYPELVSEDANGHLTVNYNGLIAELIEAIK